MSDLESRVRELLDKKEIEEVMLRYCRGVDRCDVELIRSAFHPDAYDDHGPLRMNAVEFAPMIVDRKLKETESIVHMISNHLIELEGDTAISEAWVLTFQRRTGDTDRTHVMNARYLDRFERRDGAWKIAYRMISHEWSGSLEFGSWLMDSMPPSEFEQGGRGQDDVITGGRERLYKGRVD